MTTIGIDFGTTNCSAAIVRDGKLELIPIEGGGAILPTMICITQDGGVFFGARAVETYLELTREIPIRFRFTDLRELTSVFENELQDPMVRSDNPFVFVSVAGEGEDLDLPARLFQSLKVALRDPGFNGTTVFGHYYATEELIALVLRRIRQCAESFLGEPVRAAVIGHPVTYAPRDRPPSVTPEEIDRVAHERMLAAASIAGFEQAALASEPVAAARHLRACVPDGSSVLVFDFGGGTLDLAVARVRAVGSPDIIATHGTPLGGDDFDSAVMGHGLLKYFGAGTTLGPKHLPFPQQILDPLLHWQTIPSLARPAQATQVAAIRLQSNSPETVANLQTLVRQGLGFRLFRLIEAAKIGLSDHATARIIMNKAGLSIDETLTRQAFVDAITDFLGEIERALDHVLAAAGMTPDEIDAVLMTGGSSLIPAVQGTVRQSFGRDIVRVADPFTSIAAGLGLIAVEEECLQPVTDYVSSATAERLRAEAVTIGERVTFGRGHQTVEGLVVGRAGGRMHDAVLVIEFWDAEIQEFVSTMRHETKVTRLKDATTY